MASNPDTPTDQETDQEVEAVEQVAITTTPALTPDLEGREALHDKALAVIEERRLSPEDAELTLSALEARFTANDYLHKGLEWSRVKSAFEANPEALWSISKMEAQGHEPDVYNFDNSGFDIGTCSKETPRSSVNCVYDAKAEAWCRENHPERSFDGNSGQKAEAMGIKRMPRAHYEEMLLPKGVFEQETMSWLLTDELTRSDDLAYLGLGLDEFSSGVGALEPDFHDDDTGWRGSLRVSWAN